MRWILAVTLAAMRKSKEAVGNEHDLQHQQPTQSKLNMYILRRNWTGHVSLYIHVQKTTLTSCSQAKLRLYFGDRCCILPREGGTAEKKRHAGLKWLAF